MQVQTNAQKTGISKRNNINIYGSGSRVLLLAHGFGCDQRMWRFVLPELMKKYTVVLLDYVGSGQSDLSAFSVDRYSTLNGYAQDIVDVINDLELTDVALVGHSVSSMIGLIASGSAPEVITDLIMVCPSPCFLNDLPDYEGGFERSDLEELIGLMDKNYIGWADYLAPLVMGASASEQLVGELSGSFCSTDPVIAKTFAKATFFSDCRSLLPDSAVRTLILQSANDSLASVKVGSYIHQHKSNSELEVLETDGHCIHMTSPDTTIKLIKKFLSQ